MNEQELQRINEALAIVGGVLTIAITLRLLLGPDALTQLRMRSLRAVSRTAKSGSDVLTNVAMSADTAYHRLTNVTA